MRIFLIPGLGEDEFIFDKILDALPGEKQVLSLWKLLPNKAEKSLNASSFAGALIQRFNINSDDLVIGHSTGGWVGLHLKNQTGCGLVQIASWTGRRNVITPVANRRLIYFAAASGLYFNRFVLRYALKKNYRQQPSAPVFKTVFTRLITGNRANAVNQLRLVFNPVSDRINVSPDVRIHAKRDTIIRFPEGQVCEVPGDHFCLYTFPEKVLPPILQFINQRYAH